MSECGGDLNRNPAVDSLRAVVDGAEKVTGISHVIGCNLEDCFVGTGVLSGKFGNLRSVALAVGQCTSKDGGICRHTDHIDICDQLGQLAGL